MGVSAHIVEFKNAHLQGCDEFFDIITNRFENDEREIYIEMQTWKDFLESDTSNIIARFPEEVKEVEQDLEENNGCLTYAFF